MVDCVLLRGVGCSVAMGGGEDLFAREQANQVFVLMRQRSVFGRRFSLFSKCCTSNTKSGVQRGCKVEAAGRKGVQKARLPCGRSGFSWGGVFRVHQC